MNKTGTCKDSIPSFNPGTRVRPRNLQITMHPPRTPPTERKAPYPHKRSFKHPKLQPLVWHYLHQCEAQAGKQAHPSALLDGGCLTAPAPPHPSLTLVALLHASYSPNCSPAYGTISTSVGPRPANRPATPFCCTMPRQADIMEG